MRRMPLLILLVLMVACVDPSETTAPREAPEEPATASPVGEPMEPGKLEAPPPVTVRYSDQAIELHAWTYCYANGCADGAPPERPYDIGDPEEVFVEYPLEGWSFMGSFTPAGERCGRVQRVPLEETEDGFILTPAGYAGTYDVTLEGRGDGDLFTTFRWTTRRDGPLPDPNARLAVLAGNDGRPDSYGVELMLTNLAATPRDASAQVTVTAGNGNALTFEATRAHRGCWPEGTVYWDGPDDDGLAAAQLGEAPFTYDVELELDGKEYSARATWPGDEIKGNEPSVHLRFTPALPALS